MPSEEWPQEGRVYLGFSVSAKAGRARMTTCNVRVSPLSRAETKSRAEVDSEGVGRALRVCHSGWGRPGKGGKEAADFQ